MLTIVICVVVFGMIGFFIELRKNGNISDVIANCFMFNTFGLAVGLVASMIIGGIIAESTSEDNIKTEIINTTYIYSLEDNLSTSGHFTFGSGTVNTEMKYFYIIKTNKGFKTDSIEVDNSYIKYIEDDSNPRIEKQCRSLKKYKEWAILAEEDYYVIYLPKNSVIQNYNVDLK